MALIGMCYVRIIQTMQQLFIDFLKTRRSVTAKKMKRGKVSGDHLKLILEAAIRVPDHGALKPWKLSVLTGAIQKQLDEEVILDEFMKENPDASPESQLIEKTRLQRADAVIAVISSPVQHKSIPEWEMQLSAGAVCTTLLYAAQSLHYAAQWLTEWYAYNDTLLEKLGGEPGKDRIAGFIYIGEKVSPPIERTRPKFDDVITYL